MKDFSDFTKTLTEDEIASIIDECNEPLLSVSSESPSESRLGNQIGTISLFVSLGLLRRYHEWLDAE